MKKIYYRLFILIFLIIVSLLLYYLFLSQYFQLSLIKENANMIKAASEKYYFPVLLFYILITALVAFLPIPGDALMGVLGGFLYNFFPGVIYVSLAITSGAILSFMLTRFFIGRELHKTYKTEIKFLNEHIERDGKYYFLFLRLIPLVPFFVINYLGGLTKIDITTFIITTFIGILPITGVHVYAGQFLNEIKSVNDFYSYKFYLILLALAFLSLLPVIVKKFVKK